MELSCARRRTTPLEPVIGFAGSFDMPAARDICGQDIEDLDAPTYCPRWSTSPS